MSQNVLELGGMPLKRVFHLVERAKRLEIRIKSIGRKRTEDREARRGVRCVGVQVIGDFPAGWYHRKLDPIRIKILQTESGSSELPVQRSHIVLQSYLL